VTHAADVLVIGGGIAGLQAARSLCAAGLRVMLLEARNRLGGRIQTTRCSWYPVELGAEFVHGRPAELFQLASKTGLRIAPVEGQFISKYHGQWHHSEQIWTEVSQLLAGMPAGEPDQPFQRYVERASASEQAKRHVLAFVEGFHAADPEKVSMHWLIQTMQAEEGIDGERSFRLVDGYGSLVDALAGLINASSCQMHLETVVRELRWEPEQVTAQTSAGEFRAARAVVTVPLSVLKLGGIRFVPKLREKESAMKLLEMGPAIRASLCFRAKFWESRGELSGISFLFTDDPDFPTWWTSHPLPYPTLTGWAGGRRARALSSHAEAWIVGRALLSLARILEITPAELRQSMEAGLVHDWQTDPFSYGAYSYALSGGATSAEILAAPVAETLFFAGEATNFEGHNGTVHGAMASGSRAAREVAKAAGGDPDHLQR
jgi:monoamine oxidase